MLNINSMPPITNGDKIIWTYMHPNKYGFESMALKGFEDPPEIIEFVNKYINKSENFERVLKGKITNFWLSLGWGEIVMNALTNKFFKFN
jgi:hypothetical protein